MLPNIYFTQISNLSEARFASSVMAQGIAFCLEKNHQHFVSATMLNSFKDWLAGSQWIAALEAEPSEDIREVMDYFEITTVLHQNKLYKVEEGQLVIDSKNLLKTMTPLETLNDFNQAYKNKSPEVLLFGSQEEEVGMANMDRWLDYFEALEIL